MNKRILILVGVVICMFLNVIKPITVNASSDDTFNENQTKEVNVSNQEESTNEETEESKKDFEEVLSGGLIKNDNEEQLEEETEASAEIESKKIIESDDIEQNIVSNETNSSVSLLAKSAPPVNDVQNDIETNECDIAETKLENLVESKREVPIDETENLTNEVETEVPNEIIQKAKVTFKKVDEEGNYLKGAILQVSNKATGETFEWTTGDKPYELELPAGEYTIHEVKAPDGYEKANDGSFKIDIIINEDVTGNITNYDSPAGESQLYYVTINGEEYEVYCINQGLKAPNGNEYAGKILTPDDIRKFTIQETEVDKFDENGNRTYILEYRQVPKWSGTAFFADSEIIEDYDVSDQTMTNQQLYDKTLDIIYHRNMIQEMFPDMNLTETEIRFITEWALKNYLNARITTSPETVRYFYYKSDGTATVGNYQYYVGEDGQPLMDENGLPVSGTGKKYLRMDHKFYYREYRYAPGATGAVNDVIIDPGNGDSFGQIAKGMSQEERDRYAVLYYYLIGDDNNDGKYDHPDDMQLYMYSPLSNVTDENGNVVDYYQNVLGIAGFFKDIKVVGKDIEITDKYSTETTSVTVKKVWDDNSNQDGKRPTSLTVKLSNGTEVTLNEENGWEATIENLPKYNKGNLITYTWEEVNLPEIYELTNTETKGYITTLTNSYTPEVTKVTVKKVWDDANNQDGVRPTSVTVTLSNGMKVTLNKDNNWEASIENLPVYENGEKIIYTWAEEDIKDYELIKTDVDGYITTLTNQHTPEVRTLSVLKVWADDDDMDKKRPKDITVSLLANSKEYDTIVLTEKDGWKYEFKNLPIYYDGEKITYTVREENVPDGYVASYEEDGETGIIIHNVKGQGGDEPHKNPQTGSDIVLYLLMLFVSIIGLVSGKIYLKETIKD